MSKEFGDRLGQYLKNKKIRGAQTRLAEHLNIEPQAVQQWVAGTTEPDSKKFPIIAAFLGISEYELRFGKLPESNTNIQDYAKTSYFLKEPEKNETNEDVEEIKKLIGLNLASASLQRLLAIKALLAVKEENLQGTHRLIELVERLIEDKESNK